MSACGDVANQSHGASRGATHTRTGVVVIRMWLEGGDREGALRARVSMLRDIERRKSQSTVTGCVDDLLEAVRRFAEEFIR